MPTGIVHTAGSGYRGRFLLFLRREFREILPPTLFFFVGFNLILFTTADPRRLFDSIHRIFYRDHCCADCREERVGCEHDAVPAALR